MDFKERYTYNPITDLLGKGGFARVYKAQDTLLNRVVALKFFIQTGDERHTLIQEISRAISLNHENLCRYYDATLINSLNIHGEVEKTEVGVIEYIDGGELKDFLKNNPEHLDKLLLDVLNGLAFLHHKGIIHRDLKPQNILVKTIGEPIPVAKITDFGISKELSGTGNKSSKLLGTIEYMAPEQFSPEKNGIDGKIGTNLDLWSFGLLLYELLSGETLFGTRGGETSAEQIMSNILNEDLVNERVSHLPDPYYTMIKRCLVKNAALRIGTAEELIVLLNEKSNPEELPEPEMFVLAPEPELIVTPVGPDPLGTEDWSEFTKRSEPKTGPVGPLPNKDKDKKKTKMAVVIALLLFVAAVCGGGFWLKYRGSDKGLADKDTTTTKIKDLTPFNYTAPKPVNGKLKGVVELGATGFNSFIVDIDEHKNWELKKAEFGNSIVLEHKAETDGISKGLKSYINNMIEYGTPPNDIHFIISSGAERTPEVKEIIQALKKMDYFVNTVTAEQEGQYALKAALPKDFYDDSFVVDMGSSNTKISYVDNDRVVGLETHGSKYYRQSLKDNQVSSDVAQICAQIPASKRTKCFIIGGVPFDLANSHRIDKERYTVLKAPRDYQDLADKKGEKVKSGLNIYNAIKDATGCKQFIFDWDSNFSIGFLLSMN